MVQLQDSIWECLHHHTISNMLVDKIYEAHCAWNLSCFDPRAGIYVKGVGWLCDLDEHGI
jgi:hypothetical protein